MKHISYGEIILAAVIVAAVVAIVTIGDLIINFLNV